MQFFFHADNEDTNDACIGVLGIWDIYLFISRDMGY